MCPQLFISPSLTHCVHFSLVCERRQDVLKHFRNVFPKQDAFCDVLNCLQLYLNKNMNPTKSHQTYPNQMQGKVIHN